MSTDLSLTPITGHTRPASLTPALPGPIKMAAGAFADDAVSLTTSRPSRRDRRKTCRVSRILECARPGTRRVAVRGPGGQAAGCRARHRAGCAPARHDYQHVLFAYLPCLFLPGAVSHA
jgi:hypothetical protein